MKIVCGTDIEKIERIKKSCQSKKFCEKVYSENEMTFFSKKKNPYPSMTANWASKEAFAKALGTGVRGFNLNEVSVLRDDFGKPYFEFTGKALELVEKSGMIFEVSVSHSDEYATAFVVAFKE